jgi:hypothetical protein
MRCSLTGLFRRNDSHLPENEFRRSGSTKKRIGALICSHSIHTSWYDGYNVRVESSHHNSRVVLTLRQGGNEWSKGHAR